MIKQHSFWDHCFNCGRGHKQSNIIFMPHIVPDRRRFSTAQETRTQMTLNHTHKGHTATRQHMGDLESKDQLTPGISGKIETPETQKDAYSIPHPVPPKITPRARMVQPRHLLACLWPCSLCGGKTESEEEINYIISLTYNITCSEMLWKPTLSCLRFEIDHMDICKYLRLIWMHQIPQTLLKI